MKADPVTAELPIILFEKAPKKKIVDLAFQELSALSLHWQNDLAEISNSLKNKFAIQGNLDPKILLESDEAIWGETQNICRLMQDYPGFIFNLGHGITPDIKPDKVKVMIEAIRNF